MTPVEWQPHAYQREALAFLLARRTAALFLDPGLGKTAIVLATLSALADMGAIRGTLVVAPLRVMRNVWPAEIAKWRNFRRLRPVVLHGPHKTRELQRCGGLATGREVGLTTPDSLGWLLEQRDANPDVQLPFDTLVVDESTKFKAADTLRFRTLRKLLPEFSRRYILTGTPAPNTMIDLWSQVYICDGGAALGKTLGAYRERYFRHNVWARRWEPRRGAQQQITERLAGRAMRMRADMYLELPEIAHNRIEVTLPPKAREVYDGLERDYWAVLDDAEVTAPARLVAMLKCQQVANGAVYADGGDVVRLHDAKLDALESVASETPRVLVAYRFRHDLAAIRRRFGDAVPNIGGGVSAADVEAAIAGWNAGDIPLLAIHCASGHGINLQQASDSHVVWYSLTYSLEQYQQTIARVHRQGRRERVVVHDLVARDTIDEPIAETLRRKDDSQSDFLRLVEAYRERRDHRAEGGRVPAADDAGTARAGAVHQTELRAWLE